MFYHLEGTVSELTAESIVLDCSGVGFEVTITPNTASALKIGEKAKLFITESIGENNFDLFGFLTGREKQFFKMLTSVSGIGPKAAMSILSYNTPEGLAMAIVNGSLSWNWEKDRPACNSGAEGQNLQIGIRNGKGSLRPRPSGYACRCRRCI